ncbi:phosphatase PAP2 family protein [Demequina silvatica]|uniref:phosphatase PAP2 family protein n=1 Tax=Demequina silvatica TaxID=1638988 RepID=UPI0009E38B18|nr:phosphatase PAP2 family protein [Demequina silvatica]
MRSGPGAQAPAARDVPRALAVRVLLPATLLWGVIVGVGLLLADVPENGLNRTLLDLREPALNATTMVISEAASTLVVIATAVVVSGIVWWQTRQWWFAAVPLIALALEAIVFLTSSAVIGRDRPDVDQLDHAPPTASFPSGHTGAATAVYVSFALMATRIRNGTVRVTVIVVCALVPVGVAVARVYRGMHHPTDVIAGLAVGVTCALIAWTWWPTPTRATTDAPTAGASAAR